MKKYIRLGTLALTAVIAAQTVPMLAKQASAQSERANSFSDVASSHWAYTYIEEMSSKGVVNGVGDGKFNPNATISGAEFATMIARAFWPGWLNIYREQDPNPSDWWTTEVKTVQEWAGFLNTSLRTKYLASGNQWAGEAKEALLAPLTRYDMASMLCCLSEMKQFGKRTDRAEEIKSQFSDWNQVPQMYQKSIVQDVGLGLLTGKDGGVFAGDDTVTRAEAAAVMSRAFSVGMGPDNPDAVALATPTPTATVTTAPSPSPTATVTTGSTELGTQPYVSEAYDMSKYNVPADFNKDGILTSDEVFQMFDQLKGEFPQDSPWGPEKSYSSEGMGCMWGLGCAGFALMISDRIFGDLPHRSIQDSRDLRPGDIIAATFKNPYPHWSVFMKHDGIQGYTAVSGNVNDGKVSWKGQGAYLSLNDNVQDVTMALYTRWPNADNYKNPNAVRDPAIIYPEIRCIGCGYVMRKAGSGDFDCNGDSFKRCQKCRNVFLCHQCLNSNQQVLTEHEKTCNGSK